MDDNEYENKWRRDVKGYIRKTSLIIASVSHSYVLRGGESERRVITINLYNGVRFNSLAWPTPLPGGFCDAQFIHYVEYVSPDNYLLGDGYIIHGLDEFMGLHAASAIYAFLEKLEKKCILYYDDKEDSLRLFPNSGSKKKK